MHTQTYMHLYTKKDSKFKQIPFPKYTLCTKRIQNFKQFPYRNYTRTHKQYAYSY